MEERTEFTDAAVAIADERYDGAYPRGFAHLAVQLAYPTYSFADDEAEELISIDRHGDLGIDGLYIDHEGQQLLFFQSKSSKSLGDTELHSQIADFVSALSKIRSNEWVAKAHAEMKVLANEAREALSMGFDATFAFATGSEINDVVRSGFGELEEVPEGTTLELLDLTELNERFKKLLLGESGTPTDVTFTVRPDQIHQPQSDEAVVYLTLPAAEYVEACKPYGMELFRYNPRLYLGTNKVNSRIAASLQSKTESHWFHLLNNGVTAVCRELTLTSQPESDEIIVNVGDFQVVNGCQTTMTLMSNSAEFADNPKCLVDVKIIESPGLRDRISEATNTQTAILAEDSFANEVEQKRIADLVARHSPPYFYAPKRGSWERLKAQQKKTYEDEKKVSGKYRKFSSKELAAACLAIFGEPESAKDKPRIVFEKVDGKESSQYARIFRAPNVACQWLLAVELFRFGHALAKREAAKDPEGDRPRIAEYGRYRMLHLGYEHLRGLTGEGASGEPDFLSAKTSTLLLEAIDDWAPRLLEVTLDALVDGFTDAQAQGESSGLREFFREKKHQARLADRFKTALIQTGRLATRSEQSLPEFLGFPSSVVHS